MSDPVDTKAAEAGVAPEATEAKRDHHEHGADLEQDAKMEYYKADAMEAEKAEFEMGVLECVRAYPMAAAWAFIMSCTIVSPSLPYATQPQPRDISRYLTLFSKRGLSPSRYLYLSRTRFTNHPCQ